MTPLEELKAAHRRLTVIRIAIGSKFEWFVDEEDDTKVWGGAADGALYPVAAAAGDFEAAMIATLHRTIGPQLDVLAAAISVWEQADELADFGSPSTNAEIALARAINGTA